MEDLRSEAGLSPTDAHQKKQGKRKAHHGDGIPDAVRPSANLAEVAVPAGSSGDQQENGNGELAPKTKKGKRDKSVKKTSSLSDGTLVAGSQEEGHGHDRREGEGVTDGKRKKSSVVANGAAIKARQGLAEADDPVNGKADRAKGAAPEPAAKRRQKEGKDRKGEKEEEKEEEEKKKKKKKKKKEDGEGMEAEEASAERRGTAAAAGQGSTPGGQLQQGVEGSAAVSAAAAPSHDLGERWEGMEVSISGNGADGVELRPLAGFAHSGLPKKLLKSCARFARPSPIQAHSWPVLLAGRDLIGIAATGSGKTLAYGLPGLAKVLQAAAGGGRAAAGRPHVLVLAPTRELVQQISEVLDDAGALCGLACARIYGGTPKGPQRAALKAGAAVVAATPGRLMDLMEEGCISLAEISFLVLDEADRMLDLGFEPAIRAIAKATPSTRQTVMQSATWPPAVGQLASEFLRDPIKVTVGSPDLTANHDVTQLVEVVDDRARDARLEALLRTYHKCRTNRVLVFVLYKKEAARVESFLSARGWKVAAIHGDKGQGDRTKAVARFKDGSVPLLVATDVAARGLDIPDVEYVINYSFPLTTEDYVHRIGRTGRAGRKGTAHTFFMHSDKARAGELVNVLREAKQAVPEELLKFGTTVKKKESKLYGAHFREFDAAAPKAVKTTFADSDDD